MMRLQSMMVFSCAALGACTGSIGAPGGGSTSSALCGGAAGVDPGPSFIRRMTRLEYNNAVRDLLGTTTPLANQFPTEEIRLGFNNNAAALSVSPTLAEQY